MDVHVTKLSATASVTGLAPPTQAPRIAPIMITGMVMIMSVKRMRMLSVRPRKKPLMEPMTMPMDVASRPMITITRSDCCVPRITSANTSLPRLSWPNGCSPRVSPPDSENVGAPPGLTTGGRSRVENFHQPGMGPQPIDVVASSTMNVSTTAATMAPR